MAERATRMNCKKTLVALALLAATSSVAMAQECRSLPRGSQDALDSG
jgi:hypothetical protein